MLLYDKKRELHGHSPLTSSPSQHWTAFTSSRVGNSCMYICICVYVCIYILYSLPREFHIYNTPLYILLGK